MLGRVAHGEVHRHLGVERLPAEVRAGREHELVAARLGRAGQGRPAAVRVGEAEGEQRAGTEQLRFDARRRPARRRVQHVGGDAGHGVSSFRSRRAVIFSCSPAATVSSVSGSLLAPGAQLGEHLVRAEPGRAQEEDVAELRLVGAVAVLQGREHVGVSTRRTRLLLPRPRSGAATNRRAPLAEPRVRGEGLEPVVAVKAAPHRRRRLLAGRPATGRSGPRPPLGPSGWIRTPTAAPARRSCRGRASSQRRPSDSAPCSDRAPQSRSRAMPPSGKMLSRTWVTGACGGTRNRCRMCACRPVSPISTCQPRRRCGPRARTSPARCP